MLRAASIVPEDDDLTEQCTPAREDIARKLAVEKEKWERSSAACPLTLSVTPHKEATLQLSRKCLTTKNREDALDGGCAVKGPPVVNVTFLPCFRAKQTE